MELKEYLPTIIDAARDAGIEILEVYNSDDFDVEKKGDDSPLTKADRLAHEVIVKKLKEHTEFPILSEEGRDIPYGERKDWEYFWMVDPLDGTKEFIKQNGEFTVNIALIHKNEPILGVVYAPVLDKLYFGGKNIGAFMGENMDPQHKLELIKNETDVVRIVASRSHLNDETANYIKKFDNAQTVSMGSSLKFMLIADSEADIYPRFAPTMEWDTAAAHAVLKGLELEVINMEDDQPLRYNKENLLNPHFLVKR
ncbi:MULTISPECIES: 3'(2'),5'-bisphosphate nucleotidase CysQ [Mesonia]|uniref:3'(2'),5'-bisphosphate nucleotidase CysQ n=1 Tax=Mesonia oceanica TaxID=2687242 RepID=A0AC61Y3G5_9FLAO|nr:MULTISPECIES: 3'(2'),5'-bisphosphate nucleotidase CysQ [Mesonia]MAN28524.1 3'(2'),5'-bisphosphate nucleotidase [Mesonia sp.]MAQ41206.1 3'(2'),5'-bisphosphate nucleotidase [Mesonia sp.]MBJ97304.1 3'(2'),5'-bisphosphate nucleotidase [Flavobacteriaceae bacterium]VVU98779.1 3'(2'),5'-bisphosphate nucleotidase CysQ [Mesonia oceanica]|tara:strand:+ start:457 stop:1218 length:762 start_codon:yes stop_codon:yes gene_type:complete